MQVILQRAAGLSFLLCSVHVRAHVWVCMRVYMCTSFPNSYVGSDGVDNWSKEKWQEEFSRYQVSVYLRSDATSMVGQVLARPTFQSTIHEKEYFHVDVIDLS